MGVITVTKEYEAEIAHRLHEHKGACQFVHGHSYKFFITATADELQGGMVIDFKNLKKAIEDVVGIWDHSLLLYEKDPLIPSMKVPGIRLYELPFIPTAENMTEYVGKAMNKAARGYRITAIKIYETSTSYAEWRAE